MQRGAGQEIDLDAGAAVSNNQTIFGLYFGPEDLGQVKDGDQTLGLAVLVGHDGVARLPVGAAIEPRGSITRLELILVLEQFGQEGFGIGAYGLLQVGVELAELGGVDVDRNLVRLASEVLRGVAGDGEVEAHAEREQKIAVLQGEVGAAGGHGAGAADIGRIVRGDEVGGAPGGDSGDAEKLAKLLKLGLGAGETDAVAGEQQGALAGIEGLDGLLDLIGHIGRAGDGGVVAELAGIEAAQLSFVDR